MSNRNFIVKYKLIGSPDVHSSVRLSYECATQFAASIPAEDIEFSQIVRAITVQPPRRKKEQPSQGKCCCWVYNKLSNEYETFARGETLEEAVNNAIAWISERVRNLDDGRVQYGITRTRPDASAKWSTHRKIKRMPWGPFQNYKLSSVTWTYLDRILTPELKTRDLHLYNAVHQELLNRPEWRQCRIDEELDDRESNRLRDLRLDHASGKWHSGDSDRDFASWEASGEALRPNRDSELMKARNRKNRESYYRETID